MTPPLTSRRRSTTSFSSTNGAPSTVSGHSSISNGINSKLRHKVHSEYPPSIDEVQQPPLKIIKTRRGAQVSGFQDSSMPTYPPQTISQQSSTQSFTENMPASSTRRRRGSVQIEIPGKQPLSIDASKTNENLDEVQSNGNLSGSSVKSQKSSGSSSVSSDSAAQSVGGDDQSPSRASASSSEEELKSPPSAEMSIDPKFTEKVKMLQEEYEKAKQEMDEQEIESVKKEFILVNEGTHEEILEQNQIIDKNKEDKFRICECRRIVELRKVENTFEAMEHEIQFNLLNSLNEIIAAMASYTFKKFQRQALVKDATNAYSNSLQKQLTSMDKLPPVGLMYKLFPSYDCDYGVYMSLTSQEIAMDLDKIHREKL